MKFAENDVTSKVQYLFASHVQKQTKRERKHFQILSRVCRDKNPSEVKPLFQDEVQLKLAPLSLHHWCKLKLSRASLLTYYIF